MGRGKMGWQKRGWEWRTTFYFHGIFVLSGVSLDLYRLAVGFYVCIFVTMILGHVIHILVSDGWMATWHVSLLSCISFLVARKGFESVWDAEIAIEGFENDVRGSYKRGGRMEDDASVVFVYAGLNLDVYPMALIDDDVRSFLIYWRYCLFSWMAMSSYRRLLCFMWSGLRSVFNGKLF